MPETETETEKEPAKETAPLLIDGEELARLLSMSPKWVVENRHRIIGAQQIGGKGGRWRFNSEVIRRTLSAGKDIIIKKRVVY